MTMGNDVRNCNDNGNGVHRLHASFVSSYKKIWQKERINSEDRDGATDLTIIMAEQQIERGKSHLVLCFRVLSRSRCICIK